jgi:hypothetical protein
MSLKGLSVPDRNGAPMNISAMVNFKIIDSTSSIYAVENLDDFVNN